MVGGNGEVSDSAAGTFDRGTVAETRKRRAQEASK